MGDASIPWNGGSGVLVFFLDQTETKNAERDTQAALSRQKELNDLRSRFVSMTSHEFRTPLASILSSYELLKDYHSRLSPQEEGDILEIISGGVHRMTHMLDRILLLGKADVQMLEFAPIPMNVGPLCHELIADARSQMGASRCELVSDIVTPSNDRFFDAKLLRHIFSNLPSNAIKYSPHGGLTLFLPSLTKALEFRPMSRALYLSHFTGPAMWATLRAPAWAYPL